jgi:hypothetical protein
MTGGHALHVEFCGEWMRAPEDRAFSIGRDADLVVDDNPYLHRRFLEVVLRDDLWWLVNVGGQLSATLADPEARMQAWLSPGASMPIVFGHTAVRFTAGPTSYEINLHLADPVFVTPPERVDADGSTTMGRTTLNLEQRLLVLALAEPALRRGGSGASSLPPSSAAAARLGWSITKFNRKLDNVCQKLGRAGVRGLHGDAGKLASGRRGRLVEYALAVRLVTPEDLDLLDRHVTG